MSTKLDPDGWQYTTRLDSAYWYPQNDSSLCKCLSMVVVVAVVADFWVGRCAAWLRCRECCVVTNRYLSSENTTDVAVPTGYTPYVSAPPHTAEAVALLIL
jgi:hypothetical protein